MQGLLVEIFAVDELGRFSGILKNALKRISLIAEYRSYQTQRRALAFANMAQSISVAIIRGSAMMLFARAF